jgi:hypothetical protein
MKATAVMALAAGFVASVVPAAAQTVAAVVEEVRSSSAGVGFMDYVEAGRVVRLGPRDSIVLGYLKTCVRETITGGTITIGTEHSEVKAGKVARETVACDAERMLLTSERRSETAGLVFRDGNPPLPGPQFTIYGTSPIIQAAGGGDVIIERLDAGNERHVLRLTEGPLGDVFDFAESSAALVPGGLYRIIANTRVVVFKVDPGAKPGPTPICGRLIRLAAAS